MDARGFDAGGFKVAMREQWNLSAQGWNSESPGGTTAMANQTIKETVLSVLSNPGVRKINFNLNGLTVAGHRYALVAALVRSGKIACEIVSQMPVTPGQAPPEGSIVEAMYDSDTNTMYFKRADYGRSGIAAGIERGVILHEATHALFDVFAKSGNDQVLGIDDESAAVLAQALYLKLCELGDMYAISNFKMLADGSGDLALKLADTILAANAGERLSNLQPQQMVSFRNRVAVEWNLVADGASDRSGAMSIYNGVITCFACWGQSLCPSGAGAGASLRGGAASLGSRLGGPKWIKIRRL